MAWPLHFPPASQPPPCSWLRLVLLGSEDESLACACVCKYVCVYAHSHIQHACKVWEGWRGEGRCSDLGSLHEYGVCEVCRDAASPAHLQLLLLPNVSPTCQVQTSRQQSPGCPRALGWGLQLGYNYPNGDNFRQIHMWSSSKTNCILLNSSFYVLKALRGKGCFQKITLCCS